MTFLSLSLLLHVAKIMSEFERIKEKRKKRKKTCTLPFLIARYRHDMVRCTRALTFAQHKQRTMLQEYRLRKEWGTMIEKTMQMRQQSCMVSTRRANAAIDIHPYLWIPMCRRIPATLFYVTLVSLLEKTVPSSVEEQLLHKIERGVATIPRLKLDFLWYATRKTEILGQCVQ